MTLSKLQKSIYPWDDFFYENEMGSFIFIKRLKSMISLMHIGAILSDLLQWQFSSHLYILQIFTKNYTPLLIGIVTAWDLIKSHQCALTKSYFLIFW